jgi:hypothetical protein
MSVPRSRSACQSENREFDEGEPERWSWSMTAIWTGTHRLRGSGSRWQGFGWPAYLIGRWAIRDLSAELLGRMSRVLSFSSLNATFADDPMADVAPG